MADGAEEVNPIVDSPFHRKSRKAGTLSAVDAGLEQPIAAVRSEDHEAHVACGAAIKDHCEGTDEGLDTLEALQAPGEENHPFLGADAQALAQFRARDRRRS